MSRAAAFAEIGPVLFTESTEGVLKEYCFEVDALSISLIQCFQR